MHQDIETKSAKDWFEEAILGGDGSDPGLDPQQPKQSTHPQQQPRYILHSAAEALQPQPPIDWVVERLFCAGSVSLVVGEGGSKKTWSMLDMAVCVALGVDWLGFPTQQSPVLFVDEESGQRRLARRLGDVMRGHGADDKTPIWYTCLVGFNYREGPEDLGELQTLVSGSGARLVVIDALADVMIGGDENSVKDVQPVFHGLRQVAEATDVAIVMMHHSNKAGSYRGSTAMHGAVDLLLMMDSKAGENYIAFDVEKARDVEPHKFAATGNWSPDMFNLTVASPPAASDNCTKAERYVLRYLEENGESCMEDIKAHADACSEESARRAVYSLADKRKVRRSNVGGRGSKSLYDLVEEDIFDDADNADRNL